MTNSSYTNLTKFLKCTFLKYVSVLSEIRYHPNKERDLTLCEIKLDFCIEINYVLHYNIKLNIKSIIVHDVRFGI